MTIPLPINDEAEELVLGRMMSSIDVANEAIDNLDATDFFSLQNQSLFRAMQILFKKDAVIEPATVCSVMSETYPEHHDVTKIYGLSQYNFGYTSDISHFLEIIKENSIYRKLIYVSREIQALSSEKKMTSSELQSKILNDLDLVFRSSSSKSLVNLPDAYFMDYLESGKTFLEYVQYKQELKKMGLSTMEGYSTGFTKLDKTLDGINRGHYIIVGARPGVGKTTFILNLMNKLLKSKVKIGFFSLEMKVPEVLRNFACIKANVESSRVKSGEISPIEYQELVSAVHESRILEDKLFIDDQEGLKLSQITARAKRMVKAHGVEVIFIDYIGEIKGDGKFSSKQEEIQTVSRGLRSIAKSLNVPVVCVAQLNRESEKNNRPPVKSDLRESGQIEADAHSILLLHRPDQDDKLDKPGVLSVYVVKNRFGEERKIDFGFNKKTGQFLEIDYANILPQEENWDELIGKTKEFNEKQNNT